MTRTYYRLWYRLDGAGAFLLWFSNDEDGVVTGADGQVLTFPTHDALAAYAESLGVVVSAEEPKVFDLDALRGWLDDPGPDGVRSSAFLDAWHLFEDIARSVPSSQDAAFRDRSAALGALHDKLFYAGNNPTLTAEGRRDDAAWSAQEVADLARHLGAGLAFLRSVVAEPA